MATGSTDAWNRGIFLILKKLFHLVSAVHFWYGIYYNLRHVYPAKGHPFYGIMPNQIIGKFGFLTILGAIFQASYFTLCVFNDFIGTNENRPKRPSKLRQLKDYVFAAFTFPLAMTVAIPFWALYVVNRELIFPKSIESFYPHWLNQMLHANIVLFVFIELFLSFRQYPTRKSGVTGLGIFLVGYLIEVHIIYYTSGKWVYPILAVLNLPMRMVFMIFVGAIGIGFYHVGEFLNNKIWASELKSIKPGKKHK